MDNTERDRREAEEKEKRRLKNERRERQIAKQARIERDRQEEEARRRQQYKEQQQREVVEEEERKRIEEQKRLQMEAELCRRRDELHNYKFGNKIRLDNFLGLEIEDVDQLRIGVFGSTGSGKSCFINTCERTVRQTEQGSVPISRGQDGTIILQDYLPEMFFRLVDTRGFFFYNANEIVEFENILYGRLQPGDNIFRPKDGQACNAQQIHQSTAFGQRMHGIIIVVKANDPRLKGGALKDYLKPVREILRKTGNVLILTIPSVTISSVDKPMTDIEEAEKGSTSVPIIPKTRDS